MTFDNKLCALTREILIILLYKYILYANKIDNIINFKFKIMLCKMEIMLQKNVQLTYLLSMNIKYFLMFDSIPSNIAA